MAWTFSKDHILQLQAILLVTLTQPVEQEYSYDLKAMSEGAVAQGQWHARRAQGTYSWMGTIRKILNILHSDKLYKRLRFTMPVSFGLNAAPGALLEEEQSTMEMIWTLGLEMISQYTCTHVMFGMTMPHAFAFFLLPDQDERAAAVAQLRRIIEAVIKAFRQLKSGKCSSGLESCCEDLGWPKTQLCLDMICLLLKANFDPCDTDCIRLAQLVFQGTGSTKDVLESVFAHLRDISFKANKNQRLNNFSRWFYATTSKCAMTGGHDRFLPPESVLRRYVENAAAQKHGFASQVFDMRTTDLPQDACFTSPENVMKQKWRPAGPLSHQRSAAAAAILVQLADSNFAKISDSWTGILAKHLPGVH